MGRLEVENSGKSPEEEVLGGVVGEGKPPQKVTPK